MVNGNRRWDFNLGQKCVWYDFIRVAIAHRQTHKYFVHIDEDCFMVNKMGIYDCIRQMEDEGTSLIGPTDNMWPIRGANPNAINSFFMIGKIDDFYKIWEDFDAKLKFVDLGLPMPNVPDAELETEPYYNFFWNYIKQGFSISYKTAGYEERHNSTTLLAHDGSVFAYHMWYTRSWYRKMKFVTLTHRDRYILMKHDLDNWFCINPRKLLCAMSFKQYLPILYYAVIVKNFKRVIKKLS